MTKFHGVQTEALKQSKGHKGFGFWMEQGLGKTLTDLAESAELVAEEGLQRMVVLCPNSFKSGWVDEIEKHGIGFTPYVFESGSDYWNNRFVTMAHDRPPILIVNYEAIRSESTQSLIRAFGEGRKTKITADESIQISTHSAAQTKAAIDLAKDHYYRRTLSGKPMKTGPDDYWSQMRFMGALDGVNYFQFRHRYCKMGGFKAKKVVGTKDEEGLAKTIAPWVFRALKKDWGLNIPKIYTIRDYTLSPELQRHFDTMFNEFVVWLANDEFITIEAAVTKYLKLAQIQAGFIIDEQGAVRELVSDIKNPRLQLLLSLLEDEIPGKTIVPYHHRHSGVVLERALAKYNPAHIEGNMEPGEIQQQKDKFNNDPSCRVIRLQTRASKYGHTLLGGSEPENRCSTMVFYENTYSLDDRSQIEDRNHRWGQLASSCLYIDLAGTIIDRNMAHALQEREDMFQAIMKLVSAASASLSR